MIESVQSQQTILPSTPLELSSHKQPVPAISFFSTLETTNSNSNFFNSVQCFLKNSFLQIIQFFSTLLSFFTFGYFAKGAKPINLEKTSHYFSLKKFNAKDPFQSHIFEIKNETWSLKKPIHFAKATQLFSILGTGSLFKWLSHQRTLYQLKKDILDLQYLPLEFLFYLFFNPEMIAHMKNLKESTSNVTLNIALRAAGHEHPWMALLKEQSKRLQEQYEKDPKFLERLIPGFCQLFDLDQKKVLHLFRTNKEKELILYIFNVRIILLHNFLF